jgi:bifunctional non-homologous end joining protein LigD
VLSRVHWVRPELVAEVTYLTWTAEGLLRHVVYEGLREDKSPRNVGRTG